MQLITIWYTLCIAYATDEIQFLNLL
jgi:hypothetical protein